MILLASLRAAVVACCLPGLFAAPVAAAAGTPAAAEPGVAIFVASNGWHTAIVVPRARVPADAIPEAADFPDAVYLEFGWGDSEYYPARNPTIGMALRAALEPTPAVVHMGGLGAHPRAVYPTAEVVEIEVPADGFARLVAYLGAAFARGGADRVGASAPGLYPYSLFYPATGEFHLFNTCNTWTARGLSAAGLAVEVGGTVRAEDLMAQVREIAAAARP